MCFSNYEHEHKQDNLELFVSYSFQGQHMVHQHHYVYLRQHLDGQAMKWVPTLFLHAKLWNIAGGFYKLEDIRLQLSECANAREVVWTMLGLNTEMKLRALILCWQWWSTRNKINAGDKARSAEAVCSLVYRWVNDSKQFFLKGTSSNEKQAVKWTKPVGDTTKINTDGAYFPGTKRNSSRWRLRAELPAFFWPAGGRRREKTAWGGPIPSRGPQADR